MNRLYRTVVVFCAVVPVFASQADATIETFEFAGTLTNVYDHFHALAGMDKKTEFKGSYWLDTEKLKSVRESLARGHSLVDSLFEGAAAFGMTVTVGNRMFTSGSEQNARITSSSDHKKDTFTICVHGDSHKTRGMEHITLSFTGRDNALNLVSDPLLLGGVDLDHKKISASMTYQVCNAEASHKGNSFTNAYTHGTLESFTHTGGVIQSGEMTPEPGTLAILFLGGGAIFFRRTRKKRAAA